MFCPFSCLSLAYILDKTDYKFFYFNYLYNLCGFRTEMNGFQTHMFYFRTRVFGNRAAMRSKTILNYLEGKEKCPNFGQRAFLTQALDVLC